jgi:hypothetical protein
MTSTSVVNNIDDKKSWTLGYVKRNETKHGSSKVLMWLHDALYLHSPDICTLIHHTFLLRRDFCLELELLDLRRDALTSS